MTLAKISRWILKPFRDLALILYDDLEFKAMSLPRVWTSLFSLAVFISWIADQFFGFPYEHFDALAGIAGVIWGAGYAFKKYVDGKGRTDGREPEMDNRE